MDKMAGQAQGKRVERAGKLCAAAALLAAMVAVNVLAAEPPPPAPGQPAPPPPAAQPSSPLDQPLAWLQEGKKYFAGVRDYRCTLVKQERVKGELQEENVISLAMRNQPLSVYMKWLAPREFVGQEVIFVLGKNKNKMRVQSKRLINGVIGFVSIDPSDPRVLQHSRHTIHEAGLGNLIEQTLQFWQKEKDLGKTQVKTAEYMYNNRRCIRIETTHTDFSPSFYSYRSVLYLDKETKLPLRTENYDWPRQGGPPAGELFEVFSYRDIQVNVGLPDGLFNK